jgi:VWFA-related protein
MSPTFQRLATVAGSVLLALVAPPAWGQGEEPPEARFTGELEVVEVLLDALVTDAAGNVILGLGPEDFVVEEEGREVAVESATFYSNRRLLGSSAAPAAGGGETVDRHFVLLFHLPPPAAAGRQAQRRLRLAEAGERSVAWLVEELLPGDRVAVATFGSRLVLHQDFSRDRQATAQAISRAVGGKTPHTRWPSRRPEPEAGYSIAALFDHAPSPERGVYGALEALASELAAVPGRKNLVLVGGDLPAPGSPQGTAGYPTVIEALNSANVAVYTLGVTLAGRQQSLATLAADTGGTYAAQITDFGEPLARIARESSGYYLLAVKSERPAGSSGYRQVTVHSVHPGLTVRTRAGYCAADCGGS